MFQIIFNELSAAEMSALPKMLQLDLLAEFQIMPEDLDHLDTKNFGVIERKGKNSTAIERRITASILKNVTKESRFTASCTRTRFETSFSAANYRWRRTINSARPESFGN